MNITSVAVRTLSIYYYNSQPVKNKKLYVCACYENQKKKGSVLQYKYNKITFI